MKLDKRVVLFVLLISQFGLIFSQTSSELYVKLQKLASLKKVLYVAAHPDDENTRALAWLSLGEHAQTAYFSLTRGDGGQNLIGNELGDYLGVLRTQELLAARSYDKANQYFSRAVDFGYSKTAKESLEKWGKEELLSDLVLMIRKFKPDVIITRFPPDERAGHGHHTASALLTLEAFDKAADKNYLPNQVKEYGTWQTTSVYWNTSTWWDKSLEDSAKNNPDYLIKDIGGYNELLGMSYNEIGTIARSQHKCQGFGAIIERGSRLEYFKHLKGEQLKQSFFEKNKLTWGNILSTKMEKKMTSLIESFLFKTPQENVKALIEILNELKQLPNSLFKTEKIKTCKELITGCLGLSIELLSDDFAYAEQDSIKLKLELLNRTKVNIEVKELNLNNGDKVVYNQSLSYNESFSESLAIKNNYPLSTPYWLKEPHQDLFVVKDENNLLKPENDATISAQLVLKIEGQEVLFDVGAIYKWRDPAYGERKRPTIVAPLVTVNFDENLIMMRPNNTKKISFRVHNYGKDNVKEKLSLELPKGWEADESVFEIDFKKKHEEQTFFVHIQAKANAEKGQIIIKNESEEELSFLREITYDHITTQTIISKAEITCVPINAEILKGKIAYINGVKDEVPKAIKQLGFEVDEFEVEDLAKVDLSHYQSVVLGIRIYNVHAELSNYDKKLFDYVASGGNLIMQYNTASRWGEQPLYGPKPFKISRDRVTEEDAEVTFLNPKHDLLNTPNKITKADFNDWVQERGLYFASDWDEDYEAIFSWADEGEEAQKGALIVLSHGKGQFIYTGISFFRELPNGVEGAYRLFANLLSYQPKK